MGVACVLSSFSDADDTLTLSPMLVGGVEEEDWAFEEAASTVMELRIDSGEEGRVASGGWKGSGGAVILLRRVENILVEW